MYCVYHIYINLTLLSRMSVNRASVSLSVFEGQFYTLKLLWYPTDLDFPFPQIKSLKRRKALTILTLGQDPVLLQWGNWWRTGRVTTTTLFTLCICGCVYFQTCWEPVNHRLGGTGRDHGRQSLSLKGSIAELAQHVHPLSQLHPCTHNTHTACWNRKPPRAETRGP